MKTIYIPIEYVEYVFSNARFNNNITYLPTFVLGMSNKVIEILFNVKRNVIFFLRKVVDEIKYFIHNNLYFTYLDKINKELYFEFIHSKQKISFLEKYILYIVRILIFLYYNFVYDKLDFIIFSFYL